jgi:hypothetical protein
MDSFQVMRPLDHSVRILPPDPNACPTDCDLNPAIGDTQYRPDIGAV